MSPIGLSIHCVALPWVKFSTFRAFRDYIHYWHDAISVDPAYPNELRRCAQHMLVELSNACKQIE